MTELLRGALEWAREQNVSPWSAIWLIVGYLLLRLLALIGTAVSRTAGGFFTHYNGVISTLERRNEALLLELSAVKAERADLTRRLAHAESVTALLRERITMLQAPKRSQADEE